MINCPNSKIHYKALSHNHNSQDSKANHETNCKSYKKNMKNLSMNLNRK